MVLNPQTSSQPFTTLKVTLSYAEFAILRDIYDEMWAFVGRVDPNALASLGGHNEMARTLLTTVLEAWKEERDETMGLQIIDEERALVLHLTLNEMRLLREEQTHLSRLNPELGSAPLPVVAKAVLMARLLIRDEERKKLHGGV